jgi:ribosomal RNA-processing protein 9
MSSFFTVPASQRKRKRGEDSVGTSTKRRGLERSGERPKQDNSDRKDYRRPRDRDRERDESITEESDLDEEIEDIETADESEATSEEGENATERRERLAQRYLEKIRQEVDTTGFDAEDLDKDLIAQRLKEDVDEAKGRQFRLIASTLDFTNASQTIFRANTETTTGVAVCQPFVYTISRDKTLIKWQLQSPTTSSETNGSGASRRRRPKQLAYVKGIKVRALAPQQHGHVGAILSVAASPDGKYVATGGADKKLIIWSAEDLRPLKTFTTHRDGVTGLAFAPASKAQSGFGAQLFSASMDRSVKTYSLVGEDSLAYVETLFGHQDHIVGISPVAVDQCVTVGARDRKALWWKVVDDTFTKFLGDSSRRDEYQAGSLDCVAALPPQHFVTGSDAGTISLWDIHKKKALFSIQTAHGVEEPPPMEDVTSESDPKVIERLKKEDRRRPIPRGITALAAIPGADVVLSGSWDGWVRVWKLSDDKRRLIPIGPLGAAADAALMTNGHIDGEALLVNGSSGAESSRSATSGLVPGFVNSLAVFERRREIVNEFGGKKEGESQGICVIAGTGKEMRLGRWAKLPKAKNGAVVFEVPLLKSET